MVSIYQWELGQERSGMVVPCPFVHSSLGLTYSTSVYVWGSVQILRTTLPTHQLEAPGNCVL